MPSRLREFCPVVLAAIAGAMLSLCYVKHLTVWQKFQTAIGGVGAAVYLSPLIVSVMPTPYKPAVVFLTGVFAMSVFGVVFQVIEQVKAAPIRTVTHIVGVVIDVLLAFRLGVAPKNRRRDDNPIPDEIEQIDNEEIHGN